VTKEPEKTPLQAVSFGWTSGAGFFALFGLGYWADQKFGTGYLWTMVGFLAGAVFLIFELWKVLKSLNNDEQK
jgi:hypothetical protein